MVLEELIKTLQFSPAHAIVVERSLSQIYPGFVHSVELGEDNTVRIAIEPYGFDEGGVYLVGKYPDLQHLLGAIEEYLGRPLEHWQDCDLHQVYPTRPSNFARIAQEGYAALTRAVATQSVRVPNGAAFTMQAHL